MLWVSHGLKIEKPVEPDWFVQDTFIVKRRRSHFKPRIEIKLANKRSIFLVDRIKCTNYKMDL
jgi:hypothetical protein